MGSKPHPYGFCTCKHVVPDWNRPRHWTDDEVSYLEQSYGRVSDERIAKHLGRPVLGIRLKAKRLGIRKRSAGMSATSVAEIFGFDAKTVTGWIAAGVLKARRGYAVGPNRVWLVSEDAVEGFIKEFGQYVPFDHMPESFYKELAATNRWFSTVEVEHLTGQSPAKLITALQSGDYRAAKRGGQWYVAAEELPRIAEETEAWRRQHIATLDRERDERLHRRRDKRKGIGRFQRAA